MTNRTFIFILMAAASFFSLSNVLLLNNLGGAVFDQNPIDSEKLVLPPKNLTNSVLPVESLNTSTTSDLKKYEDHLTISMKPITQNATSCAYPHSFWGGFCNQLMMFIGMIMLSDESHFSQILVEGIRWKDTFGTNQQIRHDLLFDVVHWNSYHPNLPRIIAHEPQVLPDVKIVGNEVSPRIRWKVDAENATKPYRLGQRQTSAVHKYLDHNTKVWKGKEKRSPIEIAIMKGAFRPHPEMQRIIDDFLHSGMDSSYMVLHARVEPDMQIHGKCKEKKVTAFRDIMRMLEEKFKEPPVSTLLVMLNREILEKEVANPENSNTLAVENLNTLNDLISNGAWGGRVKVVEAGSKLAIESKHKIYSKHSTVAGGIMNFFISLQANTFIGTEVSSYSSALVKSRFFRGSLDNYFYVPEGLNLATKGDVEPPKFAC